MFVNSSANICKKCNAKFSSISGLKYHSQNNVCAKDKQFCCTNCIKKFSSHKSLMNHKRMCCPSSQKDIVASTKLTEKMRKMQDKLKEIRKDIKISKLEKETLKLKQKVEELENPQINNITINNITVTPPTPTVKFGSEDFSKLTDTELLSALNKGYYAAKKLIEVMHFNDRLREYQNLEFTSLYGNSCRVHNGIMWVTMDKNEIIDKLIYDKVDIIDQIVDENKIYNKVNKHTKNIILDLLKNGYSPNKEIEVKKSINNTVYDHTQHLRDKKNLLNIES